jgi:hypothetical protein
MNDLDERFRSLSRLPVPDLWPDIRRREPGQPAPDRRRSRRPFVAAAALLVALGGLIVAVRAFVGSEPEPAPATTPSITSPIPLSGEVVDRFPVEDQVGAVLASSGSVWVHAYSADDHGILVRVDPSADQIEARIQLRAFPTWETGGGGMAFGQGSLWVTGGGSGLSGGEGVLQRINAATGDVEATTWLGGRFGADVAVDHNAVWVALFRDPDPAQVVRVDPATNEILDRIPLESDYVRRVVVIDGFVVVEEKVWPGGSGPITLLQTIDPATNRVTTTVGGDPAYPYGEGELVAVDDQLWLSSGDSFVHLDPRTLHPADAPQPYGPGQCCMVFEAGDGGIWFVDPNRHLDRFDPIRGLVQEIADLGDTSPIALSVASGTAWVLDYDGKLVRVDFTG